MKEIPSSIFYWLDSHKLEADDLAVRWNGILNKVNEFSGEESTSKKIIDLEVAEYIYQLKHKTLKKLLLSKSQNEIDKLERVYRILDNKYKELLKA